MNNTQVYTQPTSIVIFGGTGDLARTKLLPALLDLYAGGALPQQFAVIGLSRKDWNDTEYQAYVRECVEEKGHRYDEVLVNEFCSHMRYVQGPFEDSESYRKIKAALEAFDSEIAQCTNKLFYLAVPPHYYDVIFDNIHRSDAMALCDEVGSWSRLLVEKPFGKDLATAQALEQKLCSLFADEQIYRIDHYLEKDAIENITSVRFANSIIANSWNRDEIESIELTLTETKNVANRGSFYDGIGALRDVGQNHMLQMYALLTMDPVDIHNPQEVRAARAQALKSLRTQHPDVIVRGQYEGFTETDGVEKDTTTETYFKLSFLHKGGVWDGVRVTLEAGKALDRSANEAVVRFRAIDQCHCGRDEAPHAHQNVLRIQFAPEQRINLTVWTKKPGFGFELEPRELTLVAEAGTDSYSPEAYERVLFDCIAGDQTRFVSGDEVEASWAFITPILEQYGHERPLPYEPGGTGPVSD